MPSHHVFYKSRNKYTTGILVDDWLNPIFWLKIERRRGAHKSCYSFHSSSHREVMPGARDIHDTKADVGAGFGFAGDTDL